MTSAFSRVATLARQAGEEIDYVVVPFDQIFSAVKSGVARSASSFTKASSPTK